MASVGFLNEIAELGEEEALDLLERRYYDQIFSFRLGQVFYTINPWQKSAKRYQDFLQLTDQEKSDDLWSIPDCSLRELNNSSQSILFLGESGSGKSGFCDQIVSYFCERSQLNCEDHCLEDKIQMVLPILELFAHSQTFQNKNSSRFAKAIKFKFKSDQIQSAELSCSLLEKNRVIFQLEGESNFHVFYLLFLSELQNKSGALQSLLREDIDYRYIYPSDRLNDQDDRTFLHQRIPLLISALEAIGINSFLQNHLFQVLAGILLLGNVEFKPVSGSFKKGMNLDDVECCVDESDPLLTAIAMLLGKEDIANVFTAKVIQGGRASVYKVNLTGSQARANVDSLAQGLYLQIFNWIVSKINETFASHLRTDETTSGAAGAGGRKYRGGQKVEAFHLSLLDMFGFEDYERSNENNSRGTGMMNGFEQFLVNYCNEKLNSVFYLDLFAEENQLFLDENCPHFTPWGHDNTECVSLFESERGLLKLIDEHCLLSRAHQDDLSLLNLFCNSITNPSGPPLAPASASAPGSGGGGGGQKKFFHCSLLLKKRVTGENTFSISHYTGHGIATVEALQTEIRAGVVAGTVAGTGAVIGDTRYCIQGFTAGNIEKLELQDALKQSTNPVIVMALGSNQDEDGSGSGHVSSEPRTRLGGAGGGGGRVLLRQGSSSVGSSSSSRKIKKTRCQFVKNSLSLLLTEVLGNSKLHFLRCLRPNFDISELSVDASTGPGVFQREAVWAQLISSGFFDLWKMKLNGFPHRCHSWKDLLQDLVTRDCLSSSVLTRVATNPNSLTKDSRNKEKDQEREAKEYLQRFLHSSCPSSASSTALPLWFEGSSSGCIYLQASIFSHLRLERSNYSSKVIQKNWKLLSRLPFFLHQLTSSLRIVKRALLTCFNRRRWHRQRELTRCQERRFFYLLQRWRSLIRLRRREAVMILWNVLKRNSIREIIRKICMAQQKICNFLQMKRRRREFLEKRRGTVKIQARGRGVVTRRKYQPLIREVKERMFQRLCEFSVKKIAW